MRWGQRSASLKGMRTLVFESYGNNELRIGFNDLPTRRRQSIDPTMVRQRESQGRVLDKAIADKLSDSEQFQYRDKDGTLYRGSCRDGYEAVAVSSQELDIIREFQENTGDTPVAVRRGYGQPVKPTSFTRDARHRILEAGTLFDRKLAGDYQGYFATFTLPGSRLEAYDAISRWSGYIANRVLQVVRDRAKGALWFFVWELQRRGALHMHLFLALPRQVPPSDIEQRLRSTWYRALSSVADADSVDMFGHQDGDYCTASQYWQFDFQPVIRTPAQYISKYVGKSAYTPGRDAEMEEGKPVYFPHRWWGMCRELKRLVDEYRFRVCMDAVDKEFCMDAIEDMSAMIEEFEPVAQYEYTAEIGSDRETGNVCGVSYRRIFYIRPEDFPIVDVLFRQRAVAYMMAHDKANRRWRYHSTHYEGVPVWEL